MKMNMFCFFHIVTFLTAIIDGTFSPSWRCSHWLVIGLRTAISLLWIFINWEATWQKERWDQREDKYFIHLQGKRRKLEWEEEGLRVRDLVRGEKEMDQEYDDVLMWAPLSVSSLSRLPAVVPHGSLDPPPQTLGLLQTRTILSSTWTHRTGTRRKRRFCPAHIWYELVGLIELSPPKNRAVKSADFEICFCQLKDEQYKTLYQVVFMYSNRKELKRRVQYDFK